MIEFLQRVEGKILDRHLLVRGQKILVAVSGGLDSMTLLHVLKTLSGRHQWRLVVAHFNHRLRGRASDADEKLVRKTAAALKLPIVVGWADVKSFAKKSKLSIEMAARKLRHEFFAREASSRSIKTIALAHHADDQVELFFLRLFRGAGGEGLAGMKWRSRSPAVKAIWVVRPLLDFSKAELGQFARENKIRFRDDATNFSTDFLRNRIRNELLPLLRKYYQPALEKAVLRLMEITGAEAEFVGEAARSWERQHLAGVNLRPAPNRAGKMPALPKTGFEKLPVAIRRRVLQLQLAELGVATDFDLIELLRQLAGRPVSVAPNLSVLRDASGAVELRSQASAEFNASELAVDLAGRTGEAEFGGLHFRWRVRVRKHTGGAPVPLKQKESFDADKVGDEIILRHWRPGDRFQPIGLKSAVKLQDLFTNSRIPRERRRHLTVATNAAGEIFWVEGLRISEGFKLTPRTKRQLLWHWRSLCPRPGGISSPVISHREVWAERGSHAGH